MTQKDREETQDAIQEVVRRVAEVLNPVQIVLFGSHARGDARNDSDVDLLVITDRPGSRRRQAALAYRALAGVKMPSDLVVVTVADVERWRETPGTVISPALREGIIAYERSA